LNRLGEVLLNEEKYSLGTSIIIFRVLNENLKGTFNQNWVGLLGLLEQGEISDEGRKWLLDFQSSKQVCGVFYSSNPHREKIIAEKILGEQALFVMGAGHVGQAVALMAALLGYNVSVIDDRPEFACREKFPDSRINLIVKPFEAAIKTLDINERSAVVIVTRGHQFDEMCLRLLLGKRVKYLGMIGSKRRILSIFKKLEAEGMSRSDFERVRAPIGLAIGAVSPQEIAVAILAEIISEIRK
jgi:xanthine dehydrogenase accessory factor